MRVRRQTTADGKLAAEIHELLVRQPAFEERAGVDAGRTVSLKEHDIAFVAVIAAAEEVVIGHFVERGGRSEGRDMTANAVFDTIGAHHHGHGVPAHQALDTALDLTAAGVRHLLVGVDGVDVRRVGREREANARLLSMDTKFAKQATHASSATVLHHVVQRIKPFPGFEGFELGGIGRSGISHVRLLPSLWSELSRRLDNHTILPGVGGQMKAASRGLRLVKCCNAYT